MQKLSVRWNPNESELHVEKEWKMWQRLKEEEMVYDDSELFESPVFLYFEVLCVDYSDTSVTSSAPFFDDENKRKKMTWTRSRARKTTSESSYSYSFGALEVWVFA